MVEVSLAKQGDCGYIACYSTHMRFLSGAQISCAQHEHPHPRVRLIQSILSTIESMCSTIQSMFSTHMRFLSGAQVVGAQHEHPHRRIKIRTSAQQRIVAGLNAPSHVLNAIAPNAKINRRPSAGGPRRDAQRRGNRGVVRLRRKARSNFRRCPRLCACPVLAAGDSLCFACVRIAMWYTKT
jgi:hypothetical protein